MRKINTLFLIGMLLFFNSCGPLFFVFKGMKHPRFETTEHILKIADKYKIAQDSLLFTNDSTALDLIQKFFYKTPEVIVINEDGFQNVYYEKNVTCVGPVERMLASICHTNPVWIDSSKTEKVLENTLHFSSGKKFQPSRINSKIRIYIMWSVYENKQLKWKSTWDQTIRNLKDCYYPVYWINVDYLAKDFGLSKRKKIKTTIKVN